MTRYTDRLERMTARVLTELAALDPYGLVSAESDAAEYDLEARPLARRLVRHGSVTLGDVNGTWTGMFGEPLTAVVGRADADALVARLNRLT